MSLTMSRQQRSAIRTQHQDTAPDPAVRALLDHIATELAIEYVRLMEEAAETETRLDGSVASAGEEGSDR